MNCWNKDWLQIPGSVLRLHLQTLQTLRNKDRHHLLETDDHGSAWMSELSTCLLRDLVQRCSSGFLCTLNCLSFFVLAQKDRACLSFSQVCAFVFDCANLQFVLSVSQTNHKPLQFPRMILWGCFLSKIVWMDSLARSFCDFDIFLPG